MKKSFSIVVLTAFIFLAFMFLYGCSSEKDENIDSLYSNTQNSSEPHESYLVFTVLPSPPKSKTVYDEKMIGEIRAYIENADKQEIEPTDEKGWEISVTINDGGRITNISLRGDILSVDEKEYKVKSDFKDGLLEFYNRVDA